MNAIIQARGLTKKYGDLYAVNNVNLTIQPNKIYGLLGRNGAGKSTFMQLVTAQAFPTSGELQVFGEGPYENNQVLKQICFIKESQKYPDIYRVKSVLFGLMMIGGYGLVALDLWGKIIAWFVELSPSAALLSTWLVVLTVGYASLSYVLLRKASV